MKILITGISGQLGSEFGMHKNHDITGVYLNNKPAMDLRVVKADVSDSKSITNLVAGERPDWVFHCAAVTRVDWCEENKEDAWRINVLGTKNVIDACRAAGCRILFVSTDFVFDGHKGMYKEADAANPINFYGKTKLMAEWLVREYPDHVIARTGMLYSGHGGNFFTWVTEGMKKGVLYAASDIYSSPTIASELADCVVKLAEKDCRGTYHTAGAERISKLGLIRKFVKASGGNPGIVKPIKSAELKLKAARPKDSSLDISKTRKEGIRFSKTDEALRKLRI